MKPKVISLFTAAALMLSFIPCGAISAFASAQNEQQTKTGKLLTRIVSYDEKGNLDSEHIFSYSASNLLTHISSTVYGTVESFHETILTYDENGRLIEESYTDPDYPEFGNGSQFTYNNEGQLVRYYHWAGGATEEKYEYDFSGKLIRAIETYDVGKNTTNYTYNNAGQLIETTTITEEITNGYIGTETCSYSYDTQNRLIEKKDTSSRTIYDYSYKPFIVAEYNFFGQGRCSTYLILNEYSLSDCFSFSNPQFFLDADEYLAKVVDAPETKLDGETITYEFYYDGELSQPIEEDKTGSDLPSWAQSYYDFIVSDKKQGKDNLYLGRWEDVVGYEVLYINNDSIPELLVRYPFAETACEGKLLSYSNDHIVEEDLGPVRWLRYEKYKTIFDVYYSANGFFSNEILKLCDNGIEKVCSGYYSMYNLDGTFSAELNYTWDGEEVTEETYNNKLDQWVNPNVAVTTGMEGNDIYNYDGILEYLNNVEYHPTEDITFEDYARSEWIEQHMEYAASDEYEDEIVGGYDNRMMAVFRDALDDEDIKSYETRKTISAILNLDIELSEADMYELIIAEILYGERGQCLTEKTYNQNLRNSVANVAKVLVNMATSGDTANEIPADTLDSIKESYELLQTLEFGSEEYGNTYSTFISLLKGNVKDLKSKLKTELAGDAAFTGLGIVIDGAFEQYETLEDILSYINNYVAYQSTSKQLHDVLGHLLVVIYMHQGNKGLDGADEFIDELGLWAAMTNWADFQTAVISVMEAMAAYEKEGAAAIAEYAVARERETGQKFGAKALKSVTVFVVEKAASCVPVINTILLVKNVANVVVSATVILDQIFTNVDEREYALDILTKAYCVSVMLDKTVDDCVDNMSEDDFYSTTVFDESVSIYKKNLLFASGYALKYADMVLANAEEELREYDEGWSVDHLFTSRDELVAAVTWYSHSYKLLEEQQVEIRAITCHDSNLLYDPLTDEIIYNFEDSRIYIVACPVAVIVTTDTGEQIAYLSGEENQIASGYEFYFHTIKLQGDSGEYIKVAIVPDGYQIELTGTDDGIMHAFVADFTTGDVGEVETYFNIPITRDSEGYFEASSDDSNESSLVVDQMVYFNMETAEDIPTNSGNNSAWIWIACGVTAIGVTVLIIIMKRKKSNA